MNIIYRLYLVICLVLLPSYVAGQDNFFSNSGEKFTPYTIIIIIITVIFTLTAFLSIMLRQCSQGCFGLNNAPGDINTVFDGHPAARGLDAESIKSLPTYFYSDVKEHRKGSKVELECAVCLNEFLDSEALRVLPGCNHVFHPRCIDKWLASHVTCPICRRNLDSGSRAGKEKENDRGEYSIDLSDVNITRDEPVDEVGQDKEMIKRGNVVIEGKFPRSHSTGHSMGDSERHTLSLPERPLWIGPGLVLAGKDALACISSKS